MTSYDTRLSLMSSSGWSQRPCHVMTRLPARPLALDSQSRHARASSHACSRRLPPVVTFTPASGCCRSRSHAIPSTASQRRSCRASATTPSSLSRSRPVASELRHHSATLSASVNAHRRRGTTLAGKTLNVLSLLPFGPRRRQKNRGTRILQASPSSSTTVRR